MKETDWAEYVAKMLNETLSDYKVETQKSLTYANEIVEYKKSSKPNTMTYKTDILIYEEIKDASWIPRVVIETKINSITTHDAITYSQKAASHKQIHPYLRYGVFIGNRENYPLPGRLFRHGAHFDFMISWKQFEPEEYEWEKLKEIVEDEIKASKKLEEMIFDSHKKSRQKYFALHKPLITEEVPK